MEVPESPEVLRQRVATDPRVVNFLYLAMAGGFAGTLFELELAYNVRTELDVDIDTFMEGCDIAREHMDRAILNGEADLF